MRNLSRSVAVAISFSGLLLLDHVAVAQQDSLSQQFDDIRNSVGLGKDRPPIDFTERPPLVVPPTNNLPPPGSGGDDRLPINDPDLAARRKALADPRRPVPPSDPGAAAAGRDARAYLVDPPSGMRDPAAVAADITHDTSASTPVKHARKHRRKTKQAAE